MKAIILAAGRGSRLGNCTRNLPKCLVDIGDKKLLDYQLESLLKVGVSDIVMVLGYQRQTILDHLQGYPGLTLRVVDNPDYAATNTAYSLGLALATMKDDFLYLNADVLFHPEILRRLASSPDADTLAVVRKPTGDEEVKVTLDGPRIRSIGKNIDPASAYGEFIGLAKFSRKSAERLFAELENITGTDEGKKSYFEAGVDRIAAGICLTAIDITDLPCIEIDFPEDLHAARTHIVKKLSFQPHKKNIRVLFYVQRNLHLPFLEPVYDYMAENCQAELAFYTHDYTAPRGGLPGSGLERHEIERLRSKATVVHDPDDFQHDVAVVADSCYYQLRRSPRIVNVGHGLISKGWFYKDAPIVRRDNLADTVCVPGRWHKDILEKNVFSPIHLTGFIKSDAVYRCSRKELDLFYAKYNLTGNEKLVLFAPTFNDELSAIPVVQERIQELAVDGTVVLIKLHGMTDVRWAGMYRDLASGNNTLRFVQDEDFARAMVAAHVMVSDVSSAFVEFMLLDKPFVLVDNPMQKNYLMYDPGDIEYQVRDAGIQVGTIEELKLAVRLALLDPPELKLKRRKYSEKMVHKHDGNCARRAAEAIVRTAAEKHTPNPAANILFSIVLWWDAAPSLDDLEHAIKELSEANHGLRCEILCCSPGPVLQNPAHPGVKCWIGGGQSHDPAMYDKILQHAEGSHLAFVRPGYQLPRQWLKWMYYYFKWHPQAGAVKAFSSRDNYTDIIDKLPPSDRPGSFDEIADYFFYVLMGNDVSARRISSADECLMFSRDALQTIGGCHSTEPGCDAVSTIGSRLLANGYSMWTAVEIFTYPVQMQSTVTEAACVDAMTAVTVPPSGGNEVNAQDVTRLLETARAYKNNKQFNEAVSMLEAAKASFQAASASGARCTAPRERDLLQAARGHRMNKDYKQSIALLEEAKRAIA